MQKDKEKSLRSISATELTEQIQLTAASGGILYYSIEELEPSDRAAFDAVLESLFSAEVDSQMVHPRAEVYEYQKTFSPYLSDALEAAALDVQGLLELIAEQRETMKSLQKGSVPFLEAVVRLRKLEHRYIQANLYLEQISLLHSELCLEYEDLES